MAAEPSTTPKFDALGKSIRDLNTDLPDLDKENIDPEGGYGKLIKKSKKVGSAYKKAESEMDVLTNVKARLDIAEGDIANLKEWNIGMGRSDITIGLSRMREKWVKIIRETPAPTEVGLVGTCFLRHS
jgi:hypothetical protein